MVSSDAPVWIHTCDAATPQFMVGLRDEQSQVSNALHSAHTQHIKHAHQLAQSVQCVFKGNCYTYVRSVLRSLSRYALAAQKDHFCCENSVIPPHFCCENSVILTGNVLKLAGVQR